MTEAAGVRRTRSWTNSKYFGRHQKFLLGIRLILLAVLLVSVKAQGMNAGSPQSPGLVTPAGGQPAPAQPKLTKEQMTKLILEKQHVLRTRLSQKADESEAKDYEHLADDIISKSVKVHDQNERLEKLSIAQEIVRSPVSSIRGLKKKLSLRDKAKAALDEAKNQKDPKLQAKLLEKAEKLIIEYKTGKPPKAHTRALSEDEADPITADQVDGRFGDKLDKFARKVVTRFLKRAHATQDEGKRNHTLAVAKEILRDPKRTIKSWARRQNIRAYIREVDMDMRKLIAKSDPAKQKLLLKRKQEMLRDPIAFYEQIKREEEAKMEAIALGHGKHLVEAANKEKDFAKARLLLREAQPYLDAPMLSWDRKTRTSAQLGYLAATPPQCKPFVQQAFHLIRTPLEKVIDKVNEKPPAPPVSNIVNFAETSATALATTGKKQLPHDEAFDTDKNYIKLSFKGWMKKNTDLKREEKVKPLTGGKTKARLVPAKQIQSKPPKVGAKSVKPRLTTKKPAPKTQTPAGKPTKKTNTKIKAAVTKLAPKQTKVTKLVPK